MKIFFIYLLFFIIIFKDQQITINDGKLHQFYDIISGIFITRRPHKKGLALIKLFHHYNGNNKSTGINISRNISYI